MHDVAEERYSFSQVPFWGVHLAALVGVWWVGFSWWGVGLAIGLYYLRMFGITAGFHRYFAHRSYKTSRVTQFVLAWIGTMSAQKGVLWWASHHRWHHLYSDTPKDIHSPKQRGFWWAHVGWILCHRYDATDFKRIKDFAKYPELRWLNRYHLVPPLALAALLYVVGGLPALVWGFFVSTVALWHGTFFINSLAHVFGSRRYETSDTSRNSMLLALLTLGEGWHNNHHHYQSTANQGFFWWEIDVSYYVLRAMSWVGLVWDLRLPPARILRPTFDDLKDRFAAASQNMAAWQRLAAAAAWWEAFDAEETLRDHLPHLPDELAEQLEYAQGVLASLPDDARLKVDEVRVVMSELPDEMKERVAAMEAALEEWFESLPSTEELLERLPSAEQLALVPA